MSNWKLVMMMMAMSIGCVSPNLSTNISTPQLIDILHMKTLISFVSNKQKGKSLPNSSLYHHHRNLVGEKI